MRVERRDFLLLRLLRDDGVVELSCEQLFMRYLDSQMDGTTAQLFEHLAGDLRGVPAVRLTETTWLANADLRDQINPILESFKAGGGRIF